MFKNFTEGPNVFWGVFFENIFCPVFHGVIESFRKSLRNFKNEEMPRIVPKIVQICFEHVLWQFSRKKCLVFHGGSGFRNFSKESKNFQNSKIAQSRFQKCPNVLWTCFDAILPNFFAQCSMQGFSDFLDLKIWGQFSGLKKFEFGFPDLKFEVDT